MTPNKFLKNLEATKTLLESNVNVNLIKACLLGEGYSIQRVDTIILWAQKAIQNGIL